MQNTCRTLLLISPFTRGDLGNFALTIPPGLTGGRGDELAQRNRCSIFASLLLVLHPIRRGAGQGPQGQLQAGLGQIGIK